MPDLSTKRVLKIDLNKKEVEMKTFVDLNKYLGGVGLGLKLMEIYHNENPLIFAIGPLNGFFPFVSKTAIVLDDAGSLEDLYLGGSISLRLRFAGIDALVITGKADNKTILDIQNTQVSFLTETVDIQSLGLPGKRSVINYEKNKIYGEPDSGCHQETRKRYACKRNMPWDNHPQQFYGRLPIAVDAWFRSALSTPLPQ